MAWFKVDDSFYDHPKVFDLPDCAVALWVRAGTWSARNLTDGFVPAGMPARLCDDHEAAVRELVRRGLWSRTSGGYRFHDWDQYQPTRQEAMVGRERMSSGGALGNHRRWHAGKGRADPSCRYCQGKQDRVPDREGDGPPESAPNPPGPSRPNPRKSSPSATPTDEDPDWSAFWSAYPRKVGKGQARKAWGKAIKQADPVDIVRAAKLYAEGRRGQDSTYTAHPATWLNGERWNDEDTTPTSSGGGWWNN